MPHNANPITYRILVIDDHAAIHGDFRKILTARPADQPSDAEAALFGDAGPATETRLPVVDVESALQGQEGVEMAKRALAEGRPYALAFVDMRMPPGWDGLRTVQELWKIDPEIQVVICSAYSDYDWVALIEQLGSSDNLLIIKKPAEPIEILQCANALTRKWQNARALKRHVDGLEQEVTERTASLEAANRQLRYLASHDSLTGLPNRVVLDDRLSQALAHARRDGSEFAVLLIDLDRFKLVNDSLGHRAGDDLLKEVAQRMSAEIRGGDTLARLGGDEFVAVVARVENRAAVERMAQRVITTLQPPVRLLGVDVRVCASIGIAFYPHDGNTEQMLLSHADAAMYCAKEQGRNNAQCYDAGMRSPNHIRMEIESDLHHALERGQFELHYQPKADTVTDEVRSAEALIRWRHPTRGLLMPDVFIPIAEECGLIESIGEWVVLEACRQAQAWQREGLHPIRVAVNLAHSQFRLANLAGQVRKALDASGLEARFLEIELTESAMMSRAEESAGILEAVSRLGVLVSVDDFGTGYSSMSYLRTFPIDKLKIDASFIREVATSSNDASIVRAIVSLAHSLQLKVVAEGVETPEQLQFLKSIGCDQYQGFHFSPALPAGDFAALIRRRAQPGRADDESALTHSKLAVPAL